jgi:hypothetical protein
MALIGQLFDSFVTSQFGVFAIQVHHLETGNCNQDEEIEVQHDATPLQSGLWAIGCEVDQVT